MKNHNSFISKLLVYSSDLVFRIASLLMPFIGIFNSQIREFYRKRILDEALLEDIKKNRSLYKKCVLFYCSSAGEYEQARPIANRLHKEDVYVHFIFFSDSGFKFARLRHENLPYSLAPLDTRRNWKQLLSIINPQLTLIVRHELWPCFLYEASQISKVYLINSSLKSEKTLSIFLKKYLFNFIEKIFTVSQIEKDKLLKHFSLNSNSILVIGDSKYDRALERVLALQTSPRTFSELSKLKKKLIIGSAWQADCEVLIPAFAKYISSLNSQELQLVIVPHQPTLEFIQWIESFSLKYGLSNSRFSKTQNPEANIIIVDTIGQLFELYSVCSFAFVGGAMHHEVHNVLEPAAFGLTIAFGPKYKNSHEASSIASKNLARVIHNVEECSLWISETLSKGEHNEDLKAFIISNSGATDKMLSCIRSVL